MALEQPFDRRLAERSELLTEGQRTVAQHLSQYLTLTLMSSASDIALRVGTSSATVIRTVQALGYDGLPDLKRSLAHEVDHQSGVPEDVWRRRLSSPENTDSSLGRVLADGISVLEQTRSSVDAFAWSRALDAIGTAERIVGYGVEEAGHLAHVFCNSLRFFGFDALALSHTGISLAPFIACLKSSSVLVVFCPLRIFPEIEELLARAKEIDAPRVVVTELRDDSLAKYGATVIHTPSTVLTETSNLLSPLTVATALAQDAAAKEPDASIRSFDAAVTYRGKFV